MKSEHHLCLLKDGATKRVAFQFQCVTWKLEKALANIPYQQFGVSEEVQEQVKNVGVIFLVCSYVCIKRFWGLMSYDFVG